MEPRPPKRAVPPSYLAGYAETLLSYLCTLPVAASCQKDRAGLTVTVTDRGGGRGVVPPGCRLPSWETGTSSQEKRIEFSGDTRTCFKRKNL
jgi:hypothetical protein